MAPARKYETVLEHNKKVYSEAFTKLIIASCVSFVFIICQLIGAYYSGSIAILADTAHLASDIIGFAISMMALSLGQRDSDESYSFGWNRAEVIGTLCSIAVIWLITLWLIVEATSRFFEPPIVKGNIMFIVAIISLIFNLIQMKILHSGDGHYHLGGEFHDGHDHGHGHGHHHHGEHDHDHNHDHDHDHGDHEHHHVHDHDHGDHEHHHDHAVNGEHEHSHNHTAEGTSTLNEPLLNAPKPVQVDSHGLVPNTGNMNVDAAYLHVLGDLLNSVGVILAALIIVIFPKMWYMDPICTYMFSIIVMWTTTPIVKNCIQILMEGTPFNFPL